MILESMLAAGTIGAGAYFSYRYAWWRRPIPDDRPRVLMYHMIREHRPHARFNKLRVPPTAFARQLAWLSEQGYKFVFASQLFRLSAAEAETERLVCLTFDDGYADNLISADPVLAAYNACATLYLVTDRSGGWSSKKKAHHADDELDNEPKLSDHQVQQLLESGRWELGGHSRTHAHLPSLDAEQAQEEIASSQRDFKRLYGVVPETFAYPFGHFQDAHTTMVRDAGYLGAFTTEQGVAQLPPDDPMRVPRIKISGKEGMFGFRLRVRCGQRGATR